MSDDDFTQARDLMSDPLWRLNNLYYITIKETDEDSGGLVVKFKLNRAQRRLVKRLWYRNIIPKARQLWFTTLSCILALDYALFTPNFQAGIIADTDGKAKKIFRDKVLFAYERLPDEIKSVITLKKQSSEELVFSNDSSILVSTSMRGGTMQFLHISEYGKICARFPHRAREIVTGSLPAVPGNGIVVIESTAEGASGDFHDKTMRAKANSESDKKLTRKEYRLHFYPWFEGPDYRIDDRYIDDVTITDKDHEYFDSIESKCGVTLDINQRAWYVSTRDEDFSGDEQKMWQEYPSTVDECFQVATEGCYYTKQFTIARKTGRIADISILDSSPCITAWDIGNSDGTAIWVLQRLGNMFHVIDFYEAWGEPYSHAAKWLQEKPYVYADMLLPHDANHVRQGQTINKSPLQMLESLMPGHNFMIVPRIDDINWGIQQTRDIFPLLAFDKTRCKDGLTHLEMYRKRWNERQERWSDQPDKAGGHSEAADAIRQFAQAHESGMLNTYTTTKKRKKRSWRAV